MLLIKEEVFYFLSAIFDNHISTKIEMISSIQTLIVLNCLSIQKDFVQIRFCY